MWRVAQCDGTSTPDQDVPDLDPKGCAQPGSLFWSNKLKNILSN